MGILYHNGKNFRREIVEGHAPACPLFYGQRWGENMGKQELAPPIGMESDSENLRIQELSPSITFRKFTDNEIVARDKANLDIVWLKDESFEDTENLPPPAELAAETVGSLGGVLRG